MTGGRVNFIGRPSVDSYSNFIEKERGNGKHEESWAASAQKGF